MAAWGQGEGWGRWRGYPRHLGNWASGGDGYVILIMVMICCYVKFIRLYTLNMCSLWYSLYIHTHTHRAMWFWKVSGTETEDCKRRDQRVMEQSGVGEDGFSFSKSKKRRELQGLWSLEDAN